MNNIKVLLTGCLLFICITTFGHTAIDIKKTFLICDSCHGKDSGVSPLSYPKLSGQNENYFIRQMLAFHTKKRENPLMQNIASNLTEQDFRDLAAYYAKQPPAIGSADRSSIARGQQLYRAGDKEQHLPACMACHNPAGEGNNLAGIPMLAGQYATYTQTQLLAYRAKTRNTGESYIMQTIASHLTDEDIKVLASYIEGLHRVP
jgi:cytochrome c553